MLRHRVNHYTDEFDQSCPRSQSQSQSQSTVQSDQAAMTLKTLRCSHHLMIVS